MATLLRILSIVQRYRAHACVAAWSASRKEAGMIELVKRTFDVDVPVEAAWAHLARVEAWPSWAKHISSVRLTPPGALTSASEGQFRLKAEPARRSASRTSILR